MNTYEKLKTLTESKAKAIYGNTLPKEVKERLEWELCSIEKNDAAKYFLVAREIVKESERLGYHTFTRGFISYSFVSFLLETTDVSPLIPHYICPECYYSEFFENKYCGVDLQNQSCPKCGNSLKKDGYNLPYEFLFGLNGDKELCFHINVSPKIYDRLTAKINEMSKSEPSIAEIVKILPHHILSFLKILEMLTGKKAEEIPLDDQDTLNLFKSTTTCGVDEFYTKFTKTIMQATGITGFDDLIRISAIGHGTDAWMQNADILVKNKIAALSNVISSRDDVMLYLMKKGIDRKTAFEIADKVRKGQYFVNTKRKITQVDNEIKLMLNSGVPKWYIESCEKVQYLFPRAHAASYVIQSYREAYYKAHYPLEFYCAYLNLNSDKLTHYMISNNVKFLQKKLAEIDRILLDELYILDNNLRQELYVKQNITELCIEMLEAGVEFERDLLWDDSVIGLKVTEFVIRDGKICAVLEEE